MSVYLKNLAVPVNGADPLPLAFPEPVDQARCLLAGFEVNFNNHEHFLKKLEVSVNTQYPTEAPYSGILIDGKAIIQDKDPAHVSLGTVNGMVVGYTLDDPTVRFGYGYWTKSDPRTVVAWVQYLHQPLSQAAVFLQEIYIETKDTDFEVSSLVIDAGNSTLELGEYREDSMGYYEQAVIFTPQIKLQKRDGKDVEFKTATLRLVVVASVMPGTPS